jgi:phosphoglycerol transferase MdoB-like AlkP superfamily enzyme
MKRFGYRRRQSLSTADPITAFSGTATWRSWLTLAAALFILNFALTFHNIWPTLWITTRHELSVEIALLLAALAAYSALVKPPSARCMTVLAVGVVLLSIGRYAEVTAPALYGRPVNLYWDAPHVLNVATMLKVAASPITAILVTVGLAGVMGTLFFAVRWSLMQVRTALALPPLRYGLTMLSVALVGLYSIGHTSTPLRTLRWFSVPVTWTYWDQANFTLDAYRQARNRDESMCAGLSHDYDLTRIAGADVFVMFLESYGATAYDRPGISEVVEPGRLRVLESAAATGREVVSAYVQSPTFGGASWLAHSTFLTGRPVRDNGTYNLMLTQDCDVMTKAFARNGYRTLSLMPGLKRDWPEGAFYDFDAILGERALDYRGPDFGWWRIPDQYAIARLDELEIRPQPRPPIFLFFPTISSHMPFRPTPPYQPDWTRVLSEQPYDSGEVAASLAARPNWTDLSMDYAATIAYAFDYVSGYLRERPELDLVLVLVGDHQPPASVAGEGVRWDVPMHVIASRPALLDALVSAGFSPGIEPAATPIGSMHELGNLLFGGTSSEASAKLRVDVTGTGLRRQSGNELFDARPIDPLAQR